MTKIQKFLNFTNIDSNAKYLYFKCFVISFVANFSLISIFLESTRMFEITPISDGRVWNLYTPEPSIISKIIEFILWFLDLILYCLISPILFIKYVVLLTANLFLQWFFSGFLLGILYVIIFTFINSAILNFFLNKKAKFFRNIIFHLYYQIFYTIFSFLILWFTVFGIFKLFNLTANGIQLLAWIICWGLLLYFYYYSLVFIENLLKKYLIKQNK